MYGKFHVVNVCVDRRQRQTRQICFDLLRMRACGRAHSSLFPLSSRVSCLRHLTADWTLSSQQSSDASVQWTSLRSILLVILDLNEKMPGSVVDIGWL